MRVVLHYLPPENNVTSMYSLHISEKLVRLLLHHCETRTDDELHQRCETVSSRQHLMSLLAKK